MAARVEASTARAARTASSITSRIACAKRSAASPSLCIDPSHAHQNEINQPESVSRDHVPVRLSVSPMPTPDNSPAVVDDLPSLSDAEHSFAPAGVWSKCGGEVDFHQLAGESEPRHA
jgi:hypothetical protein